MQPSPASDDQLMATLGAGRREALEPLVARHGPTLRRWLASRGLQEHDTNDCLQDTWLRLVRSAPRYEGRHRFGAFLRQLALSAYRDWCRRRGDERPLTADDDRPMLERGCPATRLDLAAALERLPPHHAAVLELTVRQGLGYAEVGRRLGIPEGTVKSRVFHAVRRLRSELCDDR